MNDISEITILEAGEIKITNLRAVVGTETYAISNIFSVRMTKEGSMFGCLVAALISIGVLLGLFAIVSDTISETDSSRYFLTFAFICLSSALVVALTARPNYIIQVSGPSGNFDILQSNNKDYLTNIVEAINDAILYEVTDDEAKWQKERHKEPQQWPGNTQSP